MYDKEEMKIKKLGYAKTAIEQEGIKLCRRVVGQVTREIGRIMDQFPILGEKSSKEEVENILWGHFKQELDNVAEAVRLKNIEDNALASEELGLSIPIAEGSNPS